MKLFIKILFSVFIVSILHAQNRTTLSEQNSISCDINSIFNTDASSLGISISGILGPIEIGYFYSKFSSFDNDDVFTQKIPTLNLHLFKNNPTIPVTLVIGASLIEENYYIHFLKNYISDLRTEGYKLNGYIYKSYDTQIKDLKITPLFGIEIYRYSLRGFATDEKNQIDDETQLTNIRGQISFIYYLNQSYFIFFDPCFTINDKKSSAGIYFGIGYAFSRLF